MVRSILSVIAGYAAWTVIFLGGGVGLAASRAAYMAEDGSVSDTATLLMYLVLSIFASLAAGFVAAKIADRLQMRHGIVVAALLLMTGIPVQLSSWDLMPVWYHLCFLGLLVPVTLVGTKLGSNAE